MVITAEATGGRDQAAAEAARSQGRAGLHIAADIPKGRLYRTLPHLALLRLGLSHIRHDARLNVVHPQLLLGVDGLGAALLGVAGADGEARAAVAGCAASAVVVALAVADLGAHLVAAGQAGDGVVADGGRRRGESESDKVKLHFAERSFARKC